MDCRYFPGVHPTADLKEEEKCWVFEYRRREAISLMGITVPVRRLFATPIRRSITYWIAPVYWCLLGLGYACEGVADTSKL